MSLAERREENILFSVLLLPLLVSAICLSDTDLPRAGQCGTNQDSRTDTAADKAAANICLWHRSKQNTPGQESVRDLGWKEG